MPNILSLPRRQVRKKERHYLEDSLLIEDFEELVDLRSKEIIQPLNQLGPESPICSSSQSPPRIMAGNVASTANQANPPPVQAWRTRTSLNLAPPVHAL